MHGADVAADTCHLSRRAGQVRRDRRVGEVTRGLGLASKPHIIQTKDGCRGCLSSISRFPCCRVARRMEHDGSTSSASVSQAVQHLYQ